MDLIHFPPPHTGTEVANLIKKVFKAWDIKVPIIITDNGSNMIKAFKEVRANHIEEVIENVVASSTEKETSSFRQLRLPLLVKYPVSSVTLAARNNFRESDNGTQFCSAEFREFCRRIGVKQVTSSPEFAQSNGLVERHIQTVKRTLLKMFAEGKSLWESLAAIRSTPVSSTLPAPSILLQDRHLRGNLPFLLAELKPKFVLSSLVKRELSVRQTRAASLQAGLPSARASALRVGQVVRALVGHKWLRGVVHSVCPEPQSYVVRLDDDRLFRRTRWAINVDNGYVSHRFPMVSGYDVSHPIPHRAQPGPSTASSVQSRPTLAATCPTPAVPQTLIQVCAQPSPAGPATPLSRLRPSPHPVNSGFQSRTAPARLFGAQVGPNNMSESSDAPAVLPEIEPFGTTRSGVRFGINMNATKNK
ncbi:uncharacterized protein LOC116918546 [Daphnia magna]|uniref:uncharacterized protein LOC116918546 n=1 Tax=Daphnia magna TaxID=35525 RepID=UPI001E1BBB4B|nr:uncharacterized protein LOC116918546 [Daphnia magna]